jgi:hypothetical protein
MVAEVSRASSQLVLGSQTANPFIRAGAPRSCAGWRGLRARPGES